MSFNFMNLEEKELDRPVYRIMKEDYVISLFRDRQNVLSQVHNWKDKFENFQMALGGVLECRSNWKIYVDEFCFAVERLTARRVACEPYVPELALTPFERKYLNSGHVLYRGVVRL